MCSSICTLHAKCWQEKQGCSTCTAGICRHWHTADSRTGPPGSLPAPARSCAPAHAELAQLSVKIPKHTTVGSCIVLAFPLQSSSTRYNIGCAHDDCRTSHICAMKQPTNISSSRKGQWPVAALSQAAKAQPGTKQTRQDRESACLGHPRQRVVHIAAHPPHRLLQLRLRLDGLVLRAHSSHKSHLLYRCIMLLQHLSAAIQLC